MMENELDLLNDYRKIKYYIEEVTDYGDNKPKNELKHLEQALQQLLAIQKGKNTDYFNNIMTFKNAESSNPFRNPNDALDSLAYLSAIMPTWAKINKGVDSLEVIKQTLICRSPKEAAFDSIKSIMDTYYTSNNLNNEDALHMIDEIIKKVYKNE